MSEGTVDQEVDVQAAGGPGVRWCPAWIVYPIAAVVAAAAVYAACVAVNGPMRVEFPDEYLDLASAINDPEATQEAARMAQENASANTMQLYVAVAAALGLVFGGAAGVNRRSLLGGALGLVGGTAAGAAVGYLTFRVIFPFAGYLLQNQPDPFVRAVYLQAAAWGLLGLAAGIAVALGTLHIGKGVTAIVASVFSGVVGGLIYVLCVGWLDSGAPVHELIQKVGLSRTAWATIPPLLIGLVLARGMSRYEPRSIEDAEL